MSSALNDLKTEAGPKPELLIAVQELIDQHKHLAGPLMPILHAIQTQLGCVPREVVPMIAQTLNLTRAEVHGCISFYHDFTASPRGRTRIQICQAESCQAMGSRELTRDAEQLLEIKLGETSDDGRFSLEPVYCLGNCALSPAAMIEGQIYGRVDTQQLKTMVSNAKP